MKKTKLRKVTEGIILISTDNNIYVLAFLYHSKDVREYLINNTKSDSLSSKRYDMFHLKKENDNVVFTLNLQVRYKNQTKKLKQNRLYSKIMNGIGIANYNIFIYNINYLFRGDGIND